MRQLGMQLGLLGLVIFSLLFLTNCTQPTYSNLNTRDLLTENWQQQMQIDPKQWTNGVDPWFFNGQPAQITNYAIKTRIDSAMTDVTVRVPNFTRVVINGNFQVQLTGDEDHNSVSILGPNVAVREVAVDVDDNTVYIHQIPNPKTQCEKIIVRIGIHQLRRLVQNGNGMIVGHAINSDNLSIKTTGAGRVLLSGNINVTQVLAYGRSSVSILGAYAPCVRVSAFGNSSVNIAGRVGIQQITNLGNGAVNIVGADSSKLAINTSGGGTTRVIGVVNLQKVFANGYSRVYVYCVLSKNLSVKACDHARVGLAGKVGMLSVVLYDCAEFAGKTLVSIVAYAQTYDWAHANIAARDRFFATARDNSSIYFLGSPGVVSRFTAEKGTIIPIWTNGIATPAYPYHDLSTWSFKPVHPPIAYTTPYGKY